MSEASAAASPANIRFVQVTIPPKSVSVFFATAAALGSTVDLSRKAVAGQSVAINYYCGLEPLSVVQDDANNAPLNPEPGCASQTVFTPGCTYTIRLPSNGNGGSNGNGKKDDDEVAAGNYLILAIGGDRGGAEVRERLALGGLECYSLGQCVETEPGISAGPVRQGINVRFDDFQGGGMSANLYPPDTNIKEGITYAQYTSGDAAHIVAPSNQGIPNRRIILVPIINKSQYDNGRDDVCMAKVGAFFLRNPVPGGNGGDIRAEYIGDRVTLGNGGFLPGGAAGNPQLTVAVLYK